MDYIEYKAKKSFNKNKLRSGWSLLKKAIEIREIKNSKSICLAKEKMDRDPNDVPFVSLFIDTNASAIVSEDHDFDPVTRRFTIEQLGDVVGIYHRGLFSFTMMSELVPQVVEFAIGLITTIVKIFCDFLVMLVKAVKCVVSGSISEILKIGSRIPLWVFIALFAIAILVIVYDGTRKKILNAIKSMYVKAKSLVKKIVLMLSVLLKKLLTYVEKLDPYVGYSAVVIRDMLHNIDLLKKEIENMRAEDIAHFS